MGSSEVGFFMVSASSFYLVHGGPGAKVYFSLFLYTGIIPGTSARYSDRAVTYLPTYLLLLPRQEIKDAHSHRGQKILHNVLRRGLNCLRACWGVHAPFHIMIPAENDCAFHFASEGDERCAQPQSSENITQRASPGVKFSACMLEGATKKPSHTVLVCLRCHERFCFAILSLKAIPCSEPLN
jgi:hypothetical protein